MDFVQNLDPSKLILAGTGLSFFLAIGASPPYNLPIFLFGCYAQENAEAVQSLQTFASLLGVSFIFDIIWAIKNDQNGFFKFLTILLILLKIPTFFAFMVALRQRGLAAGHFGMGLGSVSGPAVWSMPGGYSANGREGYQTVDDETPPAAFIRNPARPPPPAAATPSSNKQPQTAPGYQVV